MTKPDRQFLFIVAGVLVFWLGAIMASSIDGKFFKEVLGTSRNNVELALEKCQEALPRNQVCSARVYIHNPQTNESHLVSE